MAQRVPPRSLHRTGIVLVVLALAGLALPATGTAGVSSTALTRASIRSEGRITFSGIAINPIRRHSPLTVISMANSELIDLLDEGFRKRAWHGTNSLDPLRFVIALKKR
jgi:hypothetical protein